MQVCYIGIYVPWWFAASISPSSNNSIKKWAKDMNRYYSKEDIYVAKKHEKNLSITDH